jgi:hypothetical protein
VERPGRVVGLVVGPQQVGQPVGADHLAGAGEQGRQQRPLPLPERHRAAGGVHRLDRPEHAEPQRRHDHQPPFSVPVGTLPA